MTACTNHYAVLHTQEVTGSSPAVSTKKFLISPEIRNFFAFMSSSSDAAFWRFSLDPNRDPKAERSGKHRRGADGIIRPSPAVFVGYMVWLMTLPMAFRIFSWVCRKESGSNMVPVLGDTNRYRTGQFLENLLEDTPHDFLSLNVYRFDVADLHFSEI